MNWKNLSDSCHKLYVIPSSKLDNGHPAKTHLAYLDGFPRSQVVCQICMRNMPIMLSWSCEAKKEGDCFPADAEWAEYWDELLHEVTCSTCLNWARGD
jgi:hypothetical protein